MFVTASPFLAGRNRFRVQILLFFSGPSSFCHGEFLLCRLESSSLYHSSFSRLSSFCHGKSLPCRSESFSFLCIMFLCRILVLLRGEAFLYRSESSSWFSFFVFVAFWLFFTATFFLGKVSSFFVCVFVFVFFFFFFTASVFFSSNPNQN